ncbi:hypothetical protein V5T82_17305 [Magnetovibrio sp. PR-2]|uniref:hypothetical protein n=1 Tax=Magnetovibrio sp. PR-2 TaxID=3120356 RepID=UPI002FCE3165
MHEQDGNGLTSRYHLFVSVSWDDLMVIMSRDDRWIELQGMRPVLSLYYNGEHAAPTLFFQHYHNTVGGYNSRPKGDPKWFDVHAFLDRLSDMESLSFDLNGYRKDIELSKPAEIVAELRACQKLYTHYFAQVQSVEGTFIEKLRALSQ